MVAFLQRCFTFGSLACAFVWWIGWWPHRPAVAWAGVLLVAGGHALFLAVEFIAMRIVSRADPVPRATAVQLLSAWLRECVMAPVVFCWRQPFRSNVVPDALPAGSALPGVVLVHGLLCNRGFWNPWMRALAARGQAFIAPSFEPVFGSIDDCVPLLDAAIRRITIATGQPPVLVCHSMGGLVARAWLARANDDTRVARVVTLGSPHRGTWLARFGHSENAAQLRLGSEWLARLAASEDPRWYRLFTCFHSQCDNIVFPPSTATLPGADNRLVMGQPHVGLAFDAEVMAAVWGLLGPPAKR